MSSGAGLYIHIPFCVRKCRYCDFFSVGYADELAARYLDALACQLDSFAPRRLASIYFGGGTPSLLKPTQIARLLDKATARHGLLSDAEITLELNPETATASYLCDVRAAGINRLSVGVQTLDDEILARLGRRHTAAQALNCLRMAVEAGFENISADVMLALPGDSRAGLEATLAGLTALPLTHLSAYLLKLMPDTPFGIQPPLDIPGDDEQAALYEFCVEYLAARGLEQYEISNFARQGFASRHNTIYWDCGDYIGLGAAAHSSLDAKRYSFPPDLGRFLAVYGDGNPPPPQDILSEEGNVGAADYIMLRLRMKAGLELQKLYDLYNFEFNEQSVAFLEECRRAKLLEFDNKHVRLTVSGMLVSNFILARLIED